MSNSARRKGLADYEPQGCLLAKKSHTLRKSAAAAKNMRNEKRTNYVL